MKIPSTYYDSEVRGRLRQWKAQLHERWMVLDRVAGTKALDADAIAFCHPRRPPIGRERSFARIRRLLAPAGATLEGVRLHGKAPVAVWSFLQPRDSVVDDPDDLSSTQNCIAVNYYVIGSFQRGVVHRSYRLWTLEIPDHAMARLMHRSKADPASCVAAAHHAALRLRTDDAIRQLDFKFLLPAGPGAFVCSLIHARDDPTGTPGLHVRARTWLAQDMLHDDQTPIIDDGLPGARLGDNWLLPAPMRRVVEDDNGMATVESWAPGMPETLAAPIDSA